MTKDWAPWGRPAAALLLAAAIFLYVLFAMSLGQLRFPGPGMWPLLVSGTACGAGLALFFIERDPIPAEEQFSARSSIALGGITSLAVFIYVFPHVGFALPALLMTLFWFRALGRESWKMSIGTALVCSFGVYFLFVGLLGVRLPEDWLVGLVSG